jgi:single-strand DNA-binding protein
MNSCVLMAQIIQEPQLRYTADNLEVTEMLVQFPNSQRAEDPPATLKVVGWANMAKEIQQNYHEGDRVILVGRLGMNTIERPEGFKEKRAELTVQQIQPVGSERPFVATSSPSATRNPAVTDTPVMQPASRPPEVYESSRPAPAPAVSSASVVPPVTKAEPAYQPATFDRSFSTAVPQEEPDPDDIPF